MDGFPDHPTFLLTHVLLLHPRCHFVLFARRLLYRLFVRTGLLLVFGNKLGFFLMGRRLNLLVVVAADGFVGDSEALLIELCIFVVLSWLELVQFISVTLLISHCLVLTFGSNGLLFLWNERGSTHIKDSVCGVLGSWLQYPLGFFILLNVSGLNKCGIRLELLLSVAKVHLLGHKWLRVIVSETLGLHIVVGNETLTCVLPLSFHCIKQRLLHSVLPRRGGSLGGSDSLNLALRLELLRYLIKFAFLINWRLSDAALPLRLNSWLEWDGISILVADGLLVGIECGLRVLIPLGHFVGEHLRDSLQWD